MDRQRNNFRPNPHLTLSSEYIHNPEELWLAEIFGRPVAKPTAILKWEQITNVYQLITKKFPRTKASAVLDDLGIIAEYAKTIVRQRQTFRSNSKAENIAQLTFEYDPDGEFALVAAMLRSKRAPSKPAEEKAKAEDGEDEKKDDDLDSITGIDSTTDPPNSSDVCGRRIACADIIHIPEHALGSPDPRDRKRCRKERQKDRANVPFFEQRVRISVRSQAPTRRRDSVLFLPMGRDERDERVFD